MAISFDTTQPAQVKGLNGYTVDPLFTVGDKIGDFTPIGILDGIGAYSLNDTTVRLLVVNEVGPNDGYKYTLANGTQLPGARTNFFDVDKRTFKITNAGLAYDTIINRAGEVVDSPSDIEFGGLNRFCSAGLFEAHQFGAGIGLADRIFFSGEEDFASGGTMFAQNPDTKTLYALPAFGRATYETVTELNTGTTDKVAFLIADDNRNSSLKLYVGNKNAKGDGSFLDRNGLGQGKLYAWVADDPNVADDVIESDASLFAGTGSSLNGKFVEIPYYNPALANTEGYDALGYATYAKQNELDGALGAYNFQRLEDQATNPADGTQAVFLTTGVSGTADQWGTTNILDVDFSGIATGNITASIKIIYDGDDADKKDFGLRNPDNLDWADNGKIYIQEDRAFSSGSGIFGGTSGKDASAFVIDPAAVDPSATLTRIYEVDRTALPADQTDPVPNDLGNWETSGILDVSNLFGAKPGELFIFDVQAHSVRDGSIITATNIDGNGDGTKTRQENLVEGGQLAFLVAPNANLVQSSSLVAGATSGADIIEAKVTTGFDGINDIVFAGAGNDIIDSAIGGALASNNNIDAGTGNDEIFLANGDRVFGSDGNDIFDAGTSSNYRASGGAGDDVFYLRNGSNGRALGGDGADKFYVGLGGSNLLSGGAGADQFWIVNAELPTAANTVLDFQIGTDVIGIKGAVSLGITTANLTLTQVGADTEIVFGGQTLATLSGIQASALSLTNPNQFFLD